MTEAPLEPDQLNILHVRQEVFMGDHAETVSTAVAPEPGETVEHLVKRVLGHTYYGTNPRDSIVIRIAEPRKVKEGEGPW